MGYADSIGKVSLGFTGASEPWGGGSGSGSHCAFEIDKTTSTKKKNEDGKCIMFHQLNYRCKLIYCPECASFVKAQALITFQELKG